MTTDADRLAALTADGWELLTGCSLSLQGRTTYQLVSRSHQRYLVTKAYPTLVEALYAAEGLGEQADAVIAERERSARELGRYLRGEAK